MYYETERQMAQPTPRRVRFTQRAKHIRGTLLMVGATSVFLLARQAMLDIHELENLAKNGQTIMAPLTGCSEVSYKRTQYSVVEFSTWVGGVSLIHLTQEPIGFCFQPTKKEILFTYLPDNATAHRIGVINTPRITAQKSQWIFFVALVVLIFGNASVLLERFYRVQYNLWKHGQFAKAEVIRQWDARGGSSTSRFIEYAFHAENGERILAQKQVSSTSIWISSKTIGIFYDPKNPTHHRPVSWCRAAEIVA
jgi:hypothetical protein